MRIRIQYALFASFLGVVTLVVVLLLLNAGRGLRAEMDARYRTELGHELGLLAEILRLNLDADSDSLADALSEVIGYRVSFIDGEGTVIGDSEVAVDSLVFVENHLDRPEVAAALDGTTSFEQRASATVGVGFLYAAAVVAGPEGPVVVRIAAPLNEIENAIARTRQVVAGAGVLGGLVSLLVAAFLSRRLARPLEQLSASATALADGDFAAKAPKDTALAEMGQLSDAFNRLSDELRSRLDELSHERDEMRVLIDTMAEGVVALTEDGRILRVNRAARGLLGIEEPRAFSKVGKVVKAPALRKIVKDSVEKERQAEEIELGETHLIVSARPLDTGGSVVTMLDVTPIRRLERVRRDFVANASHELKTPLTAIRGFAETMLEDEPPPGLRQQFLGSIQKNTVRLQRLVDDLLDLSQLESGTWQQRAEVVPLALLGEEMWEATALELARGPLAIHKQVHFEVDGDSTAWADPHSIDQIFRNLFSNALRYVDDGGHVTLRIREIEDMTECEVVDDGAGIPGEDVPRIFERFYRADSARSRDAGGTGLGLAIVRHLVVGMGGEVGAESTVGEGTTIRFSLPTQAPDDAV